MALTLEELKNKRRSFKKQLVDFENITNPLNKNIMGNLKAKLNNIYLEVVLAFPIYVREFNGVVREYNF